MTGRIQAARERAANARHRLAIFAVAGFVTTFGLAAASHGGTTTSNDHASAVEQPADSESGASAFDFGSADIGPADDTAPQLRTQTS